MIKSEKIHNKNRHLPVTMNCPVQGLKAPLLQPVSLIGAMKDLSEKQRFDRYRKMWEQAGDYRLLTDFPMHLDIELSGLCNLSCEHCFQNQLISGDLGFMDWDLYRKIIDEGSDKGLCAVKP